MAERASKDEVAVYADEALERGLLTGEVLRERGLCPLVVVRSTGGGVHIGLLAEANAAARAVTLLDARRLWRWYGANTLSEVARDGVTGAVRLAQPVPQHVVMDVTEILPVSAKAAPSLTESRWAA
jgi:hypothetical protein